MLHLIWVLRGSMHMLRTCEDMHGRVGWPKCVGRLGWFKWLGMLGWLELPCPTVCSNPELLQNEMEHLRKALTNCKYPKWTLDKVEKRLSRSTGEVNDGDNSPGTAGTQPTTNEIKTKGHIVIPYTQSLCKSIKKIFGRYGIQTHFKGSSSIKNLLVSPKDKDSMVNYSRAIYWFQCGDLTCNDEYIGGTSRTFGERFKEHLKDPFPYIIIAVVQVIPPPGKPSK